MKKTSVILFFFAFYLTSAFGQENLNTTRIGVWPYGRGNTVAVHEDHIFLSHGRTIQVYEYANPEQPGLLGELFLDDRISVIAIYEGMAYAAGYDRFYILDVANPGQPQIIASLSISTLANAISFSGNYAYLALQEKQIYVIDISDAQNPVVVATNEMQHLTNDIVMMDGLAWIATGSSGIMAYDMGDPATPDLIYHYPTPGNMRSLAFVEDQLYAFDQAQGLMIFDIANLPDFNLLSVTYMDGNGTWINIENEIIAVTLNWNGFVLYDISNPSAPDSLGRVYADMPNRQVIMKDGYAFHCHGSAFNIFDINDPTEMTLLSSIGLSGPSMDACYWNDHIYVGAPADAITILNITNPQNVVKVSELEKLQAAYEVHVDDNLLFRSHYNQILVYDVTDPSNPVFLNSFNTTASPEKILKHNNLFFVAHNNNLEVFDISDIMLPNQLGIFPYGGTYDMIAEGNLLYLANTLSVVVLDINDPSNISQLSSIQNLFSRSLALKDSLLYVVSNVHISISEKSLNVFDITDPTSINRVESMEISREFENVFIDNDYLYVYEQTIGLQIYDIRELTPVYCGFYSNRLYRSESPVVNGLMYVPVVAGIDIVQNDLITSTENIFIERSERLSLFPNPADEVINFVTDLHNHSGVFTWEIMQVNGTAAKSGKLAAGQQQISLNGLPAGVYVLKILKAGEKYKSGLFIKH